MDYIHVTHAIAELSDFCFGNDCYTCILCDGGRCILNILIHRYNSRKEGVCNKEVFNKATFFRVNREKW